MTDLEKTKALLENNEKTLRILLRERDSMKSKDFEKEIKHFKSKIDSLLLQKEEIQKQIKYYNAETNNEDKRLFALENELFVLNNEIAEAKKKRQDLTEYYVYLSEIDNKIKWQEEKIAELREKIYGNVMK